MKTILFMRHAKSDWEHPGLSDHDRPLNQRGVRVAKKMGEFLQLKGLVPEFVIASTAARVQETLALLQKSWTKVPEVHSLKNLYLAAPETFYQSVEIVPDQINTVMVIGHNPGLERLATLFAGGSTHFPTAAILLISSELDEWSKIASSPLRSGLKNIYRPKELGFD